MLLGMISGMNYTTSLISILYTEVSVFKLYAVSMSTKRGL